ncbi:MAG TPA: tannase/feruloyl esterase family alpha/beta hydrolase [Solirubrobacteraceae bacterium]
MGRGTCLVAAAVAAGLVWWPPAARAAECAGQERVKVPGAETQELYCEDDLSTATAQTNGRTDRSDWATLHHRDTRNPTGIPGLQVEGYFPDDSTTNSWQGRNHDSQYVIRLPDEWNGKLVVTGAPGVRRQYANDFILSDWLIDRGYAFASTDKGNTGTSFYNDGDAPGDALAEWHRRVTELTLAAKAVVEQKYGRAPSRTYISGISNGGYLTRWQIENRPDLYDGGVDWEGTYMDPVGPNLFWSLPPAIKYFPRYRAGDEEAHQKMLEAGWAPGSEFLWEYHYAVYWDLTQRTYREELDPEYDGGLSAGIPFCQSGTPMCDADYDYSTRGQPVRDAIAKASLTGRIGKPVLTLHGTLDSLLPIRDTTAWVEKVRAAGLGDMHRYYVVDQGTHVDSLAADYPDRLRPILPCYRAAFLAMERWVEQGEAPPPSQTIARPSRGDVVNECTIPGGGGREAPTEPAGEAASYAPPVGAAAASATPARTGRARARGLSLRVRPRVDVRAPYRFTARGRLLLPSFVTADYGCGEGVVSVQIKAGGRTISTRRVRLRNDCTFRSAVTFRARRRLGRGVLRVVARFEGNSTMAPISASVRRVRAV